MEDDQIQIIEAAPNLRKWRTEIPNLYDDAGLDPYAFRLLVHYCRRGTTWESVRTTAGICQMSVGQVVNKRRMLHEDGWIKMKKNEEGITITVTDKWAENFDRYSRSPHERGGSPDERERSPHEQGRSPHEPKKEPLSKTKKRRTRKKVGGATSPPPIDRDPQDFLKGFEDVIEH